MNKQLLKEMRQVLDTADRQRIADELNVSIHTVNANLYGSRFNKRVFLHIREAAERELALINKILSPIINLP